MTNIFGRETFTDYEIDAMIREADSDNDGLVTYDGYKYFYNILFFKYILIILFFIDFLNMMTTKPI